MIELVKYVVGTFVGNSEQVEYNIEENENVVNIIVKLLDSDIGKVIGKGGKLAKALRTILKIGGQKENKKYNLEIKERA